MKLSIIIIFTLLPSAFSPFQISANPLEQKTTQENTYPQKPFYYFYCNESVLYLNFYNGCKYKLSISKWLTDDIICEITFSFGRFTVNDDQYYTFRDFPTGIEFRASKSGDSLMLAERIMMKGDMEAELDNDINQRYYLENLAKIQKIELRDSCPVVNSGIYLHNTDAFLMLNLKSDNEYEFQVLDVPISSGHWYQRNAEIILSDSTLNKEFKLIVDKDHLICSFMPGYLIGTELYLKEPDPTLNPSTSDKSEVKRVLIPIVLIVLLSLGSLVMVRRKRKARQTTHRKTK